MFSRKIKQVVKKCLATTAGWRISAPLRRQGVIALTYHRVNANTDFFPGMHVSQFRDQMDWLRKNCTPIWPEDVFDAARSHSRIRPPVLITFDDGYRDYFDNAYPILHEMRIPSVMFLSTDLMDRGGLIWTEALRWAVMKSRKSSARTPWQPEQSVSFASVMEREAFVTKCKHYLKGIPDKDRQTWLSTFLHELDAPPPTDELDRQMLNWNEVKAMREGTRFGGHSHTHPILSQLAPDAMEQEIVKCRDRIASELGEAPRCFAYPNGRACDFNDTTKSLLQRHGFNMAFANIEGINGPHVDHFALFRQPSGGSSIGDLAALVAKA